MRRSPVLVLDPKNSDATFGSVEEAEIWMVDDHKIQHTGIALEKGYVITRTPIINLIHVARSLVDVLSRGGDPSLSSKNLEAILKQIGE